MDTLTAPDRLALLLPWLNDDLSETIYGPHDRPEDGAVWTDFDAIRRAIDAFVRSFDGSAACGFLSAHPDDAAATLTDEERLAELGSMLRVLLELGFESGLAEKVAFAGVPTPTLRFEVRGALREKPTWTNTKRGNRVRVGGAKAVADYRAAGAYVLHVHGATLDLLPFLIAHLLTQPDAVAVRRCKRHNCDRLFVRPTKSRGRPQDFCRPSCQLLHTETEQQQLKRSRKTSRMPRKAARSTR